MTRPPLRCARLCFVRVCVCELIATVVHTYGGGFPSLPLRVSVVFSSSLRHSPPSAVGRASLLGGLDKGFARPPFMRAFSLAVCDSVGSCRCGAIAWCAVDCLRAALAHTVLWQTSGFSVGRVRKSAHALARPAHASHA